LSYARRISKFTLPNAYRESDAGAETTGSTPKDGKAESETGTPAAVNGADRDTQMSGTAMDGDGITPTATQSQNSTSLPQDFSQFLNPLADLPFIPWPTEEAIRRGALASIQVLLDQDIDPATFDPAKSAELEDAARE
jgi:hypothetical protein